MNPMDLLSDEQQMAAFHALARAALVEWGLLEASLELVARRENAVYRVVHGNRAYALRVHRHGYHGEAELNAELQWMRALSNNGIQTPSVVPTLKGELFARVSCAEAPAIHLCDLIGWIEGKPLGSADNHAALGSHDTQALYRSVGLLAAQIHTVTRQWPLPAGFARHHWDAEGCLGRDALWGYFGDLESLDTQERAKLVSAALHVRSELAQYGQSSERYGLVHADLVPDNLIRTGDGIAVLDFDDSGFGWYLWELVTAVYWYIGTPHFDAALLGYLEGYDSVRPVSQDDRRMLMSFLLLRGLVYMGWMHTRKHQPTASKLTGHVKTVCLQLADRVLAGEREVVGRLGVL